MRNMQRPLMPDPLTLTQALEMINQLEDEAEA